MWHPQRTRGASFAYVFGLYLVAIGAAGLAFTVVDGPLAWRLGGGLLAATMVTFVAALHTGNGSVFDPWWSVLPPVAAIWLWIESDVEAITPRQLAVFAVVGFWAVRLTTNWAVSWPGLSHEDWRYRHFKAEWPVPDWVVYAVVVEGAPSLFVWLGCLPLIPALTMGDGAFGWLDGIALAIGLGATALELAADEQMRAFAATKAPGDLMQRGLWKHLRHPNYLGELLFWIALWLFAVAAAPSVWWVAIGPLAMIGLFVFASIPLLDTRSAERRPGWGEYASRTPALLPRLRR